MLEVEEGAQCGGKSPATSRPNDRYNCTWCGRRSGSLLSDQRQTSDVLELIATAVWHELWAREWSRHVANWTCGE